MAQQFVNFVFNTASGKVDRIASTEAGAVFLKRFDQITKEVAFSPTWANGTGYYDGAIKGLVIGHGQVVRCYDNTTDRLLIIVGCRGGNVVIHERYRQGKDGVYVKTDNNHLLQLVGIPTGVVGLQSMIRLLGDWEPSTNIGVLIEELREELK